MFKIEHIISLMKRRIVVISVVEKVFREAKNFVIMNTNR